MKFARRTVLQITLGAAFAGLLLAVGPTAPAAKLGAAINYKYQLLLPDVTSDGR